MGGNGKCFTLPSPPQHNSSYVTVHQWRAQGVNIVGRVYIRRVHLGGSGGMPPRNIFEIWVSKMALFPHSDSIFERNPRDINYVYFHS